MPVGFEASEIAIEIEHEVLITAFDAPPIGEEEFYLMFQHKDHYSKQDIKLGMNKPYIEFRGQGWSWYGQMLKVQLERNLITVLMDQEAAQEMGNDGIIQVKFSCSESRYAELSAALKRTFSAVDYFTQVG